MEIFRREISRRRTRQVHNQDRDVATKNRIWTPLENAGHLHLVTGAGGGPLHPSRPSTLTQCAPNCGPSPLCPLNPPVVHQLLLLLQLEMGVENPVVRPLLAKEQPGRRAGVDEHLLARP